jgi:hypothetical protein
MWGEYSAVLTQLPGNQAISHWAGFRQLEVGNREGREEKRNRDGSAALSDLVNYKWFPHSLDISPMLSNSVYCILNRNLNTEP